MVKMENEPLLKQVFVTSGAIVCTVSVIVLLVIICTTPVSPQGQLSRISKLLLLFIGLAVAVYVLFRKLEKLCLFVSKRTTIGIKISNANKKIEERSKYIYPVAKTVIYIFVLYFVSSIAAGHILDTNTPFLTVASDSMYPTLQKGDVIIISGDTSNLHVGDIIIFNIGNKYVVHRIVEIKLIDNVNYFITKGDNNITRDPFSITQQQIVGKVVGVIPLVGYISLALKGE